MNYSELLFHVEMRHINFSNIKLYRSTYIISMHVISYTYDRSICSPELKWKDFILLLSLP